MNDDQTQRVAQARDVPIDVVARILGYTQGGARQRLQGALAALPRGMLPEVNG